MDLTKQQRAARDKAVKQAAMIAIKAHFTGAGSSSRIAVFLRGGLMRSSVYAVVYAALTCFVAVGAITIGYEHEQALSDFRTWILSMSSAQLSAKSHELSVYFGLEAIRIGLFAGLVHQLILIAKPSVDTATEMTETPNAFGAMARSKDE